MLNHAYNHAPDDEGLAVNNSVLDVIRRKRAGRYDYEEGHGGDLKSRVPPPAMRTTPGALPQAVDQRGPEAER